MKIVGSTLFYSNYIIFLRRKIGDVLLWPEKNNIDDDEKLLL
jgi:hypothetical protein